MRKCSVARSQETPLVTEWPASEKANLEAGLADGGVAVAYSGCEMRVLSQCKVRGSYRWQRTTPSTDVVEIRNEDELYARLPLGALSLAAELRSSGRLAVQTTVAGQLRLTEASAADVPTDGGCEQATHLIAGVSVGAFKLFSGGQAQRSGRVSAGSAGLGGGNQTEEILVRQAGSAEACDATTDESASPGCRSPIQMFLWPLPRAQEQLGTLGGDGTTKVSFYSDNPALTWEVIGETGTLCKTPCTRWVDPRRKLLMKTTEGNTAEAVSVDLAGAQGTLNVTASGPSLWMQGLGGTVAIMAGIGTMLTGALWLADDCAPEDGTCQAMPIAFAANAAALTGSIFLLAYSGPSSSVDTVDLASSHAAPSGSARAQLLPGALVISAGKGRGVVLTPGGVTGAF